MERRAQWINKKATIKEILESHGWKEANGVCVPISEEANEVENDFVFLTTGPRQKGEPTICTFQSLVGSLLGLRDVHVRISALQIARPRGALINSL